MPNKYISQVTMPNNDIYYLKDAEARQSIADMAKFTQFLGVTTTAIVNGSTINPISIDGEDVTAVAGDIVIKGDKEFIFNGSAWAEFGDVNVENLGDFAIVDQGYVDVKEYDSAVNLNGTAVEIKFTGTASGDLTGSVSVPATFTKPNITVDDTTSTGTVDLNQGTLPSLSGTAYSVTVDDATENLSFSALTFSQGTLPSLSGTTTFVTGVTAELDAAPAIASSNNASVTVTGFTPAGTISVDTESLNPNYTPAGTVTPSATTATKTVYPGTHP